MNNNDDKERCVAAITRLRIRAAVRQGRTDEIQAEVMRLQLDAKWDALELQNIETYASQRGFTVSGDSSGA